MVFGFLQAPAFVFVDEIDAIAGRHARKDPGRRGTFEALISQLDGELVIMFSFNLCIGFIIVFDSKAYSV